MRNTQANTVIREESYSYTVSADFEENIREHLNQIFLTEAEEDACIAATD